MEYSIRINKFNTNKLNSITIKKCSARHRNLCYFVLHVDANMYKHNKDVSELKYRKLWLIQKNNPSGDHAGFQVM